MYKAIPLVIMVLVAACGTPIGEGSEGRSAEHADESLQYTLFSEQLEFFIEHPPLEAGQEAEFLVHLTDLDSYKPCSTGNVTIIIDEVSVTSGEPADPGIFHIAFMPEKEGEYHAKFIYNKNEALVQEVEEHVRIYKDHASIHDEGSREGDHSHGSSATGEIEFLKEQAWGTDFMVEKVLPGPFHSVITTSGELLPVPGEKQHITAGSQGIVRFADPALVQGSRVNRGQVLFTLSSETLLEDQVKLRYEEAKNRLEKSRNEYERHKVLFANSAISQRLFQESRANFVEDSLRFYSLAANITAGGVMVVAPVTGTIHELLVSDGEYTEPGNLLATLSSNNTLLLRADLPQQYYDRIGAIRTAHFRPAYSKQVFRVDELHGILMAAGVSVAENDHYLPVIFRLENDGRLLEGAFSEVYLHAEERQDILKVPVSSLSEEQGRYYVYVQYGGETFSKRPVRIGESDGLYTEITEGLQAGERIITRGVMLVKAASLETGVVDHGHSH